MRSQKIGKAEKALLAVIWSFSRECRAKTQTELGKMAGMSERTVRRTLTLLLAKNLVHVRKTMFGRQIISLSSLQQQAFFMSGSFGKSTIRNIASELSTEMSLRPKTTEVLRPKTTVPIQKKTVRRKDLGIGFKSLDEKRDQDRERLLMEYPELRKK